MGVSCLSPPIPSVCTWSYDIPAYFYTCSVKYIYNVNKACKKIKQKQKGNLEILRILVRHVLMNAAIT